MLNSACALTDVHELSQLVLTYHLFSFSANALYIHNLSYLRQYWTILVQTVEKIYTILRIVFTTSSYPFFLTSFLRPDQHNVLVCQNFQQKHCTVYVFMCVCFSLFHASDTARKKKTNGAIFK